MRLPNNWSLMLMTSTTKFTKSLVAWFGIQSQRLIKSPREEFEPSYLKVLNCFTQNPLIGFVQIHWCQSECDRGVSLQSQWVSRWHCSLMFSQWASPSNDATPRALFPHVAKSLVPTGHRSQARRTRALATTFPKCPRVERQAVKFLLWNVRENSSSVVISSVSFKTCNFICWVLGSRTQVSCWIISSMPRTKSLCKVLSESNVSSSIRSSYDSTTEQLASRESDQTQSM